jgi:hypothetical protein
MTGQTARRVVRRVALGLALAALLAPGANAAQEGYGELYQHRFLSDGSLATPSPDPGSIAVPVSQARASYGVLYQHPSTPDVTLGAAAARDGIEWADAGVGAATALGGVLVVWAAAMVLRRRRLAHG